MSDVHGPTSGGSDIGLRTLDFGLSPLLHDVTHDAGPDGHPAPPAVALLHDLTHDAGPDGHPAPPAVALLHDLTHDAGPDGLPPLPDGEPELPL